MWLVANEWRLDMGFGPWEHIRRQLYSMTVWWYAGWQFVTLTVLDWPKDTRARYPGARADTWTSYIGTTLDGLHMDLSRIYTGVPLIPYGPQESFDSVGAAAAAEVVTWQSRHWVFYLGCT